MSTEKYAPANIDAECRRELLCIPPPGPFDANCSALNWVSRLYNRKKGLIYQSVFILSERVNDFKAGESTRGQCGFYTARKKGKDKGGEATDQDSSRSQVQN